MKKLIFSVFFFISVIAYAADNVSYTIIPNLAGGLIENTNPISLANSNASSLNNIEFKNGIAQTRLGYTNVISNVKRVTVDITESYYWTDVFDLLTPWFYFVTINNSPVQVGLEAPAFGTMTFNACAFETIVPTINNYLQGTLHIEFDNYDRQNVPASLNPAIFIRAVASINYPPTPSHSTIENFSWPDGIYFPPTGSTSFEMIVTSGLLERMNATHNEGFRLYASDSYRNTANTEYHYSWVSTWNITIDTPNSYLLIEYYEDDNTSRNINSISGTANITDYRINQSGSSYTWTQDNKLKAFHSSDQRSVLRFPNLDVVGTIAEAKLKLTLYANYRIPATIEFSRIYPNTSAFVTGSAWPSIADEYISNARYGNDPAGTVYERDIPISWFDTYDLANNGLSIVVAGSSAPDEYHSSRGGSPPLLKIYTFPTVNNKVTHIYSWIRNDSEEFLFGSDEDAIYKVSTDNNFDSFYTELTEAKMTVASHKDRFYFTSDDNGLIITDGDTIRPFNQTPTISFSLSTVNVGYTLGLLGGTYNYTYTFSDTLSEWATANSTQQIKVSSQNEAIVVSLNGSFPNSPTTVSSWSIYRSYGQTVTSAAGILNTLFLVVPDTGGRVTDDILDSNLGKRPPNFAPSCNIVYSWLSRLWLADDVSHNSWLYHTPASGARNRYDGYWSGNYPLSPVNASDIKLIDSPGRITGLGDVAGNLVIFKEREIFAGVGQDPNSTSYIIRKVAGNSGTVSHETIKQNPNSTRLYYQNFDGRPFYYSGYSNENDNFLYLGNFVAESIGDIIEDTYKGLNTPSLNISTAGFLGNKYMLSVPDGTSTYNNLVIVWDDLHKNFTKWSIESNGFARYKNEDYFVGSIDGFVKKFTPGTYNDEGDPISTEIWTKPLDLGNPYEPKEIYYIDFLFESSGDWDAQWALYTDSSPTTNVSGNINLSGRRTDGIKLHRAYEATGVQGTFFNLKVHMNSLNNNFRLHNIGIGNQLRRQ